MTAPAPGDVGVRGGGATELYAVLGRPIAHSLSPRLHQAGFQALGRNAVYVACDVGEAELGEALAGLAALGARGANLTAPLKTAALAHLSTLTDEARAAGAVNTVAFDPGGARGHNTDGAGFVAFLARHAVAVRGAHIAVIGGGGAALGLVEPLLHAGALDVALVVRDPKASAARSVAPAARRGRWLALGARDGEEAVRAASIVVQATPLGAAPGDPLPCPAEWIDARAVAVDLRYHPATTPWLAALKARRVRAANGLGLLIEQALLAQEFWNHATPPRTALEEAVSWSDPFAPA